MAITKKMWDMAWDMWEHRNGIMHLTENKEALNNMDSVDADIWYQFQQGLEGLPQRVQYLFAGRVDDLLQSSIHTQKEWLQTVEGA
jgi:hypothetical protein